MIDEKTCSLLLATILLLAILTSIISFGPGGSLPSAGAQVVSQSQAAAAIKNTYDSLIASGVKGSPGKLLSTGDGFARPYLDFDGTPAFVIFWKPNIGAYAVAGPIMMQYKSMGWFHSSLGYPTDNEKDLPEVSEARYTQFENGVLVVVKGKGVESFPTVQAAIDALKRKDPNELISQTPNMQTTEPAKVSPVEKYRVNVTFDTIDVHEDHDYGDAEYALVAYAFGTKVDLTQLSTWDGARDGLTDVDDGGAIISFKPNVVNLDLDNLTPLTIVTAGWEDDGCGSGLDIFPSSITKTLKAGIETGSAIAAEAGGSATGLGPVGAMAAAPVADKAAGYAEQAVGYAINKISCTVNENDSVGEISQGYESPIFGTGQHCDKSDTGDYTLCYTVSAQKAS